MARLIKLLVIEKNETDHSFISNILTNALSKEKSDIPAIERCEFEITSACTLHEANKHLKENLFDAILLTLSLPEPEALELLQAVLTINPNIPVLAISELGDPRFVVEVLHQGAQDLLMKNALSGCQLIRAIHRAMNQQKAKLALETAAQHKTQFLSNMSHEIRTPLTSILGFAETLTEKNLSEEISRQAIASILRNGNHLLNIIKDILDFSKVEAGKLDLELLETSIFEVMFDIEKEFGVKALQKGLGFEVQYEYPIPAMILTDPTRLKQIIVNLVGNAIKFTREGYVKIEVKYQRDQQLMLINVIDTGVGINRKQLSHLFKAFAQADATTTRVFGGTGLGLCISKSLAEMLGGNIDVVSVLGTGTVFTLSINAGPVGAGRLIHSLSEVELSKAMELTAQEVPQLVGSVLLVEDGEDNQEILLYFLNKTGIEVTVVENGQLAVEYALRKTYDLILMDMQMPVMDGYTATEILREKNYRGPIIALTANVLGSNVDRALKAGCNSYVGKPFKVQQLYATLSEILGESRSEPEPMHSRLLEQYPRSAEIILNFLDGLPQRLKELLEYQQSRDLENIGKIAHRFANAGMFGYPELSVASQRLEIAAQEGSFGDIDKQVSVIRDLCKRILKGRQKVVYNFETVVAEKGIVEVHKEGHSKLEQ